jgi:hypothetical protein
MDMLVSPSPNLGDIVTIMLLSGVEVVGKLVDRKADLVTIARPIQVSIQPMGKNLGLAFVPVLGSVSEAASVQIPLSAMAIRPVKTGDDVTRNYIQATTGLVTAAPSGLITP